MTQTDIFSYLYPDYKITKPIRLIELFTGVGTFAMALRDLGANFTHWKTCEWNYHSILSYAAIHCVDEKEFSESLSDHELALMLAVYGISADGKSPMTSQQIERLPENKKRLIYNAIVKSHNLVNITNVSGYKLKIVNKDKYEYIMTYSFPCQDLSIAGRGKGMNKDSDTRSSLIWQVERILLELKEKNNLPQILIMENVPNIIGKKNIDNFMEWYNSLSTMGYRSYYKLLNAKDYGVPQNRNRCFMVSILGDYSYTFPAPIPLTKRMKDVLEHDVDEKYYLSNEKISNAILNRIKTENDISNAVRASGRSSLDGHSWDVIQMCLNSKVDGKQPSLQDRIYDINAISTAITTSYMPSIYDQRIRKLTPLECWRLMDYTDEDFYKAQAVNSNTQLYKQAGNGIVRSVLMAIFNEMIERKI